MCLGYSATISICYLINHLENLTWNTKSLNHLFWKTLQIIRNSIIDQMLHSHLKCNKNNTFTQKFIDPHSMPLHTINQSTSKYIQFFSVFRFWNYHTRNISGSICLQQQRYQHICCWCNIDFGIATAIQTTTECATKQNRRLVKMWIDISTIDQESRC